VIECGRRARLHEESGIALRVGAELAEEELERDVSVEASVVREIHPPHSPTPDLAQQCVRPLDGGSGLGCRRGISRGSAEQPEEVACALVRADERAKLVGQPRVGA
jgi:hypothetical protein